MTNLPIPEAAKYWLEGQPKPPAPIIKIVAFFSFN